MKLGRALVVAGLLLICALHVRHAHARGPSTLEERAKVVYLTRFLERNPLTRREHTLVTRGPYRWVRHPFYDAMALLFAGIALIAANWFVLVTGVVVFLLLAARARTEEAHLLARFGDAYRTHSESTGRFLPKLHRTIGTS